MERLKVYIGPRRNDRNGKVYPKWPYHYKLPGQEWVHGTGGFTKASTRQFVDGLIQDEMVRVKMADRGMGQPSNEPIQKHIQDYLEWGKRQGNKGGLPWSIGHHQHQVLYLQKWVEVLGLKTLGDVRFDAFDAENTSRLQKGMAPNTVNHHSWALVSLFSWCVDRNRVASNPLSRWSSLDRRPKQERGAFTIDEFQALLKVAPSYRRLVYCMAVFTGFRRSALASLCVKDVDFSTGHVTLHWKEAKNHKTTIKPISQDLLNELFATCAGKEPNEKLLTFSPRHAARNIHRDMKNAGIPIMRIGQRRDFHSLKATLGTILDSMGVSPELIQKALDHAAFRQTEGYIKRELAPLKSAINEISGLMLPSNTFQTQLENMN